MEGGVQIIVGTRTKESVGIARAKLHGIHLLKRSDVGLQPLTLFREAFRQCVYEVFVALSQGECLSTDRDQIETVGI